MTTPPPSRPSWPFHPEQARQLPAPRRAAVDAHPLRVVARYLFGVLGIICGFLFGLILIGLLWDAVQWVW